MADDTSQQAEGDDAGKPQARKAKIKVGVILAAVALSELLVVMGAFFLAGGPQTAPAESSIDLDALVEIPLLTGTFSNARHGEDLVYEVEIFVVTRVKHQEALPQMIQNASAQVLEDIRQIIASAELSQLREPRTTAIRSHIHTTLDKRLGLDEEGRPYIDRVILSRFMADR